MYMDMYYGYMYIPFLWELRVALDWWIEPTSLDLFQVRASAQSISRAPPCPSRTRPNSKPDDGWFVCCTP